MMKKILSPFCLRVFSSPFILGTCTSGLHAIYYENQWYKQIGNFQTGIVHTDQKYWLKRWDGFTKHGQEPRLFSACYYFKYTSQDTNRYPTAAYQYLFNCQETFLVLGNTSTRTGIFCINKVWHSLCMKCLYSWLCGT